MAAQTWLITGANRGFGRALTEAALDANHRVAATVRGTHSLPEHPDLLVLRHDVRDRAGAIATVAQAVERFGQLDFLVNNAGYGLVGAIEEVDEAEARQIVETDLLGALWLVQAALPPMRAQRSGHIVQISTTGAVGAMPMLGLYNAAKWGLEGWSEALAAEVRPFGIRVTIAEMGALDTEWATGSMKFGSPIPAYDVLRSEMFGTSEIPWPAGDATGGGTVPRQAADDLMRRLTDAPEGPPRIMVGDDTPEHVHLALATRMTDYRSDPRFPAQPL
jgi:NAD(P)-dependent dehydrogenase (short-subunit alcohol dehydrogenase family)